MTPSLDPPASDPTTARGPRDRGPRRTPTALPTGLRDTLEAAGISVTTDPDLLAGHCTDWTGRWRGPALGAVSPGTTEQVAVVLGAARSAGVPVQVQGGNTGLVGGSVPDRPALLLLTGRLDRIDPVDSLERTVVVGAGVTAAQLAHHARASGLHFGVDLAARDSATIGGMVATNAGGIGVCAHGMMREQVRGLVAVLADGRVVRTVGRPRKDNCGLDLGALVAGSEGILGVITEVEIGLHPAPGPSSVALLAVRDLAEAVRCARRAQSGRSPLLAAEVVDAAGVARAVAALGLPDPLPEGAGWLLLLEVADGATGAGLEPVADHVVAVGTEPADRQRFWGIRERQTELYASLPRLQKLDVSVRLADLDAAVAAIREVVAGAGGGAPTGVPDGAGPDAGSGRSGGAVAVTRVGPPAAQAGVPERPWLGFFGHALDGNLHVQLVGADGATADRVLEAVAALGGGISAEHGIGRAKAGQLHLARSAEMIDWMRQIKATVDPDTLLNPGVLLAEVD